MADEHAVVDVATVAASDSVTAKLLEFALSVEQIADIKKLGVETVADLADLVVTDLTGIGIVPIKARKIIAHFARPTPSPVSSSTVDFDAVLPTVPDDTSWLASLRSSGVLRVEQSTVISAVRAAIADKFGLYEIPGKLIDAMEAYVEMTDEQVPDEFWQLRKQLTKKSYGDLFAAIDGLDSSFVTSKRKAEFFARLEGKLWPALASFNEVLSQWQLAWMQGSANPALMINAIMAASGSSIMPTGLMQPPDCGALRDAAEAVNDSLNQAFRGTGVQITAALAYEANQVKAMIDNPRLPILCGVASRDLLLKKIGVIVPATYPRMEINVIKFVLGVVQSSKVATGPEEAQYFGTLYMLGSQIPWNDLCEVETKRGRTSVNIRTPSGLTIGSK